MNVTESVSDPRLPDRTATDPDRRPTLFPPRTIGRYQLCEIIGTGGMGVVHRAYDPELKREVAVKLVRARNPRERARVLREAEAMAKLRHPNVVPLFDIGTHGEVVYLVMPLLAGGTLRAWMHAGPQGWRDVVVMFLAAARGLASAHALGLIHRDFKPENVLLGEGGAGEIQVADFGIARVDTVDFVSHPSVGAGQPPLTQCGAVVGTPAYMAPEQLDGVRIDARADQFGFCVSLYEAVAGRHPFVTCDKFLDDLALLRAAIRRGVPPVSRVPHWLRAVIARVGIVT
jgi:eukaryotic-like serine/threonine-protein kinase